MLIRSLFSVFVYGLCFMSGGAQAATTATTQLTVSGTVIIPPCDVNNNAPLDVDFGNVSVSGPLGPDTAEQEIRDVPVTCAYYQGTPYVKLSGALVNGTTNCIATNINDFCISFYQGDGTSTEMVVGAGPTNIGYPVTTGLSGVNSANGNFRFTMVPNRQSAALQAGAFAATATMSLIYN